MDQLLSLLELRQLNFVDVDCTESETESKLIKKFITRFFRTAKADDTLSSSFQISLALLQPEDPPLDLPSLQETALVVYEPPPTSIIPSSSRSLKPGAVQPLRASLFADTLSAAWRSALLFDLSSRSVIKRHMSTRQIYTASERLVLKKCSDLKVLFQFSGLMSPTTFPQRMRAMDLCQSFHNTNAGDVFGLAGGFVTATCDEVAASIFDSESAFNLHIKEQAAWAGGDLSSSNRKRKVTRTIARPNAHSRIDLRQKPAPPGAFFDGREFLNLVVWERISSIKIVVCYESTEHEDFPPSRDFVRATNRQYAELTEIRPGLTHLQTYFHTNLNGNVPTVFTNITVPKVRGSTMLDSFFSPSNPPPPPSILSWGLPAASRTSSTSSPSPR